MCASVDCARDKVVPIIARLMRRASMRVCVCKVHNIYTQIRIINTCHHRRTRWGCCLNAENYQCLYRQIRAIDFTNWFHFNHTLCVIPAGIPGRLAIHVVHTKLIERKPGEEMSSYKNRCICGIDIIARSSLAIIIHPVIYIIYTKLLHTVL